MRPFPAKRRRTRRCAPWIAAAFALALAGGAAAAPAEADAPDAPSPGPVPVVLVVRSDGPGVDPEAVRLALEDELQWWVISVDPTATPPDQAPRVTVELSAARGQLSVRYEATPRRPLVRVVPLPPNPEGAIRTIAWLAGNLLRDQASDLLGSETPPPAPDATPPPVAAEPGAPAPVPSLLPSVVVTAGPPAPDRGYALVTASLFFPLATNGASAGIRTRLSLNLLYGRVGVLDRGVQLGVANEVIEDANGAQLALLYNLAGGSVDGAQLTYGVNVAGGNVRGLQVALVSNSASGDLDGVQFAAVNTTRGHVDGGQAGLVNSAGNVRGLQLGLVNIGRKVRGVQLGLVNVSDDIEGLPIGIINVSATGGVHPVVWTSGTTRLAVGLKFSTRNVYTLFSGAAHEDQGLRLFGPGLALGFRAPIQRIVFESDLGGTFLFGGPVTGVSRQEGLKDDIALASWRALLGLELHRRFTLFAGAALTARLRFFQVEGHDVSYEVGPDLFAGVQL